MIFRQLFDSISSTYTYLIASRHGGEALIIDPVLEKIDNYIVYINTKYINNHGIEFQIISSDKEFFNNRQ